jgi:phosphoribosyl-ATP pyrophosphohydrolase
LVEELSDLIYHTCVLMENDGVALLDLFEKLDERHG